MSLYPLELLLSLRHLVVYLSKQFRLLLQLNVDVLGMVLQVFGDS